MKTRITSRLSLRAKFKDTSTVEVVIMDDKNHIQIEVIPIHLIDVSDRTLNVKEKEQALVADVEADDVKPNNDQPTVEEEKEE